MGFTVEEANNAMKTLYETGGIVDAASFWRALRGGFHFISGPPFRLAFCGTPFSRGYRVFAPCHRSLFVVERVPYTRDTPDGDTGCIREGGFLRGKDAT